MSDLNELWERPRGAECMIAGWHQWADAGDVSSGLPRYLIDATAARRIGEMRQHGFYLFQIPATHHLLRPVIKLSEGHSESLQTRSNDYFYSGDDDQGLVLFLGDEPHHQEERYAEAFLDAVEELGIKRVAIVAGVHGPVPHNREREISCVYSLPRMKAELANYAIRFSDYEGGTTIGTYIAAKAERREVEVVVFFAMVPSYDFSHAGVLTQRMAMDEDFTAWYELMRRLAHMFDLDMDLSDLQTRSEELTASWDAKIDQLSEMPQLDVQAYLKEVNEQFTERTFLPSRDIWEEALGDLFNDSDP